MFGLRYLKNVTTLEMDTTRCNGCRKCISVCPHAVFAIQDRTVRITDRDACMECGACALNCPDEALTVRAGVGCAAGILQGAARGTGSTCGDDASDSCCC